MSANDPLNDIAVGSRQVSGLIIVLMAATLPHFSNLSADLIGFFVVAALWRLAALRWPNLMPGKWFLALLMIAGIALVLTEVPLRDGRLAGTALLVVMLGLKLLELRSLRDIHLSVFLGFFVILTQFLYNQNLWLAIYLFSLSGLLIGLLININRCQFELLSTLQSAAVQVLLALPMALVLFLFFPRLDAPLWAVSIQNQSAVTGISDHMRLGDIGKLSQSEKLAFRVRFLNREPDQQQLYWRGPVLWDFDGRTWSPGIADNTAASVRVDPATRVDYEITMEPSGQYWVFPLDVPHEVPNHLKIGSDLQLGTETRLSERALFRLSSNTGYQLRGLTPLRHRQGLQLPPDIGSRTLALAQRWRRRHPDNDQAVVDEALQYFRQQGFVYTLSPGVSAGDPVESFLFDNRRGFCEHYAGSFTLLMRLAGIPARAVVGYQGGTRNPLGDHFSIRQSDAHAWSEVWLKDKGWTRIDPTAAVAPDRIEYPIDIARSTDQGNIVFGLGDSGWLQQLARNSLWVVDAVESGWYRWVLGFTPKRQESLMESLGLAQFGRYAPAVILGMLLLVFMLIAGLLLGRHSRTRIDPLFSDWQRYQRKLRKAGLDIPHWWGPEELAANATTRWPRHATTFNEITRRYIELRYGTPKDRAQRNELRRQIRRFQAKGLTSKIK